RRQPRTERPRRRWPHKLWPGKLCSYCDEKSASRTFSAVEPENKGPVSRGVTATNSKLCQKTFDYISTVLFARPAKLKFDEFANRLAQHGISAASNSAKLAQYSSRNLNRKRTLGAQRSPLSGACSCLELGLPNAELLRSKVSAQVHHQQFRIG